MDYQKEMKKRDYICYRLNSMSQEKFGRFNKNGVFDLSNKLWLFSYKFC